jgi:hypothetical protein
MDGGVFSFWGLVVCLMDGWMDGWMDGLPQRTSVIAGSKVEFAARMIRQSKIIKITN